MGLAPDIDSRKECSLGIRGGDLRTGKATIRNPQQNVPAPCEDARIGRGAHGIENHHTLRDHSVANPLPHGRREPADVPGLSRSLVGA